MISRVTIISLLFFATGVFATESKRCEFILVSEDVQDKVHEMAMVVAELVGEMKVKIQPGQSVEMDKIAHTLTQMTALVEEIRANFTKSPAEVDRVVKQLSEMINQNESPIRQALRLTPPPARHFMKREILRGGGTLTDMWEWSGPEVESFLHGESNPIRVEQPAFKPTPPPVVNWPDGHNPNWPPRERY